MCCFSTGILPCFRHYKALVWLMLKKTIVCLVCQMSQNLIVWWFIPLLFASRQFEWCAVEYFCDVISLRSCLTPLPSCFISQSEQPGLSRTRGSGSLESRNLKTESSNDWEEAHKTWVTSLPPTGVEFPVLGRVFMQKRAVQNQWKCNIM